jgi:DNA (cytosine-5)-methyltransferase 1
MTLSPDNPHYAKERKHAKPRLLDLFCGAGGAAMGYSRAGFQVVGVDINPQPHYPFEFHQVDALSLLQDYIDDEDHGPFDAIHASPPCQGYSRMRHLPWLKDKQYALLIDPVRDLLEQAGLPWVIENVEDSTMPYSTVLCGLDFGLPIYRHRRFGANWLIMGRPHQQHTTTIAPGRMLGDRGRVSSWERNTRLPDLMGCPWMTQKEVAQAIPPAYTEFIGAQLLAYVEAAA